jgi:hypothetical protein
MAFSIRDGRVVGARSEEKGRDAESAIVVKHSLVPPLPLVMLHRNDSNSQKEDYCENGGVSLYSVYGVHNKATSDLTRAEVFPLAVRHNSGFHAC